MLFNWDFYHTYGDEDDRKKMFFVTFKGADGLIYSEAPTPGATAPTGYSYMPDVATRKYADSTRANNTYYDGHSVGYFALRRCVVKPCRSIERN